MTGINLNVQNSYAAAYSAPLTQTNNVPRTALASTGPESTETFAERGEKLTLSAEAIALSQQTPAEQTSPVNETPSGGGAGIRPPEVTPLGGGAGIRPPLTP